MIICALDVDHIRTAKNLVDELGDLVNFYKIGLQIISNSRIHHYFDLITWLNNKNKQVMLDLKLFDTPRTVEATIKNLAQSGVDWVTMHAQPKGLEAAMSALSLNGGLQIAAVTCLTSSDGPYINELALQRAKYAIDIGCHGLIASALDAPKIRKLSKKIKIMSPGIRSDSKNKDDHFRTSDVKTAIKNGVAHLILGRPILQPDVGASPKQAVLQIMKEARI